jgi:hypothetical protein
MLPEPHPDHLSDFSRLKAIRRGSRQAIEDKAIAAYMKAFEERGREEAEKQYFETFNKISHDRKQKSTGVSGSRTEAIR